MGILGVKRRGKNAVIEGQGRLDKPGHAGRGHRVTDHRGDGAEVPFPVGQRGEDRAQGTQLGSIGGGHSQPVSLDQEHGSGLDSRTAIRLAQGAGVATSAGRGQPRAPAVAGDANRLDQSIDPVAVALGVDPAFQDDDAGSLARQHPVSAGRERPGRP